MTLAEWFDLGLGAALLALAVVLARVPTPESVSRLWLGVGVVFCVVRSADLIIGSLRPHEPWVGRTLDAVALLAILAVVFGTGRLRRALQRTHEDAEQAQAEYGRALLEYTQLVRHRIANPLTAVIGGAQTLRDLPDLDKDTQLQLLDAIIEKGKELENVALHPDRLGPEELTLEPTPAPLAPAHRLDSVAQQGGEIEADFRDVNQGLIARSPAGQRELTFVCECAVADCATPVRMALTDYFEVHSDGAQFVVAPEHNLPAIEDVVRREPEWWVVHKRGKPGRDARKRA